MARGLRANAIGWMLLTGLLFVAVTGIVRHLGSDLPAVQAAFLRYVSGAVVVAAATYIAHREGLARRTRPPDTMPGR